MLKFITSTFAGFFGFVATTETIQDVSHHVGNNAYIYGIIASGLIQIIIKIIERYPLKKKIK